MLPITASLGVSVVADATISVAEALARTDAALYVAKRTGRNRVIIYESEPMSSSPHPQPRSQRERGRG